MPTQPTPLVVNVAWNEDEHAGDEARISALELLVDWILEDRAAATPAPTSQAAS